MKIASYVVTTDTGFAPNPFWGWCTLAACTPNHKPYRICERDWIIGTSTAATGNKLIFAMYVSEVMHHHAYFLARRFTRKKPREAGLRARGERGVATISIIAMTRAVGYHEPVCITRTPTPWNKTPVTHEFS